MPPDQVFPTQNIAWHAEFRAVELAPSRAQALAFLLDAGLASVVSLLGLLTLASAAHAQQLYKCGNTYSQTPCANDAKPTRLHQGVAPDKAAGVTGFELCAAKARSAVETPEPESARIQQTKPRVSEVIQYAGQPLSSHRYDLSVDAKTRFGVFSGPVSYSCWLSEDQARVLQFGPRRAP